MDIELCPVGPHYKRANQKLIGIAHIQEKMKEARLRSRCAAEPVAGRIMALNPIGRRRQGRLKKR